MKTRMKINMFMLLFGPVAYRHSNDDYWLCYGEPWRLVVTYDDETALLQHESLGVDENMLT